MLTSAHFHNFRCLADVKIAFEPLTILVGPNASGKSAVVAGLDPQVHRGGRDRLRGGSDPWRVEFGFEDGSCERTESAGGPPRNFSFQSLQLDLARMREPNRLHEERQIARDGFNLTNVFATLTRSEQGQVAKRLSELVPVISDVVARPKDSGNHRLVFQDRWQSTSWYEPDEVSDGTILLLAFLVLQYQPAVVDLVAIEEPERGLHPYLLGELVKMLRALATGKLGPRAIQVILATHSAELLEFARPEEVRFLSRRAGDGTTQIESAPTQDPQWVQAVREYDGSLGGIWLSGSLGGVPGS